MSFAERLENTDEPRQNNKAFWYSHHPRESLLTFRCVPFQTFHSDAYAHNLPATNGGNTDFNTTLLSRHSLTVWFLCSKPFRLPAGTSSKVNSLTSPCPLSAPHEALGPCSPTVPSSPTHCDYKLSWPACFHSLIAL